MKVSGRCYCGQISFEAEIQPDKVRVCHCTDCQTLSGSAFRTNVRKRDIRAEERQTEDLHQISG